MKKTVKQTLTGGLLCAVMFGLSGNLPEAVRPWSGAIQAEAAVTFSDFWFQDEQGNWKVKDGSGNVVTNAWLCDDAIAANGKDVWYLLDANGNMVTAGLVQDGTGNFYSIEMNHNGYYGMLRYKSELYDGVGLTLESSHEGSFAKILNQDGIAALTEKYGVTNVAIDNNHCVYTSSFSGGTAGAAVSKGSSGGGGGGSSSGGSGGGSGSAIVYDYEVDNEWENYSDNSVSYSANDFTTGNYSKMSADERRELQEAIAEFKAEYITAGMSDFEKEIKIIEWLVENCSYERGDGWENSTAYSCIVNGRAQCSGYADAFLQTAKACGIEARYVYNNTHAWNLVRLDGDWYHVDVTWEDPIGSNFYGFGNLRNAYINLEDSRIKGISSHHSWSPTSTKATGIKYGPQVVSKYMKDGVIDTSLGISFKDNMDKFFASVSNEDGSNIITYTNVDDTANKIAAYIGRQIDERQSKFEFAVRYGSEYTAAASGNYSKLVKLNDQVEDKVNAAVNSKYSGVLKSPVKINLFLKQDASVNYYSHETGSLNYNPGQGLQISYTIHMMCDGTEVYTQTGTAERNMSVALDFPEGYSWISNAKENYTISKGEGSYGGKSFRVTGRTAFEMSVNVRNTAMTTYTVEYVDMETREVLAVVTGSGKVGENISLEEKAIDGYVPLSDMPTQTLNASSVRNRFSVNYGKVCTYTIQYVCDTDGEILESVTKQGAKNARITIPYKSFEDHEQKSGQTFEHKLPDGEVTYTIHYTRKAALFTYTVKYVDQDDPDHILGTASGTGKENQTITISQKSFTNYQLVPGQNLKPRLDDDKKEFVIEYAKQYSYTISYRRSDESGSPEFERSESKTAAKDSTVNIKAKTFDGLVYVEGAGSQTVSEDHMVFVVYYKAEAGENGKDIDQEEEQQEEQEEEQQEEQQEEQEKEL